MTEPSNTPKQIKVISEATFYVGFFFIITAGAIFATQNWDSWTNKTKSLAFLFLSLFFTSLSLWVFKYQTRNVVKGSVLSVIATLGYLGSVAVLDVGGKYSLFPILTGLITSMLFHLIFRNLVTIYATLIYLIVLGISAIQLLMSDGNESSILQSVFISALGLVWMLVTGGSGLGSLLGTIFGAGIIIIGSQLTYSDGTEYITFIVLGILTATFSFRIWRKRTLIAIIGFTSSLALLAGQLMATVFGNVNSTSAGFLGAGFAILVAGVLAKRL